MTGAVITPSPRPPLAAAAGRFRSSEIRDLLRVTDNPNVLSLAGGLPAPEFLPTARVGVAVAAALDRRGANGSLALQYGPTEGLDELRDVIARGTPGSARIPDGATTLITTGSQQALELVVRALVDPGDPVVVEDPLYLGTRQVLAAHAAHLVPIAVDADGLDVERLADALAEGLRPKLVVVVPNFSNPSGATLSDDRRAALAELAMRYGFVILEDDPYHGLSFAGTPDPSITSRAPDHTVLVGSASKMIAPGLRVGWLGAPAWLAPTLGLAKQSLDLHTSTLGQLVVADIVRDRAFLDAHLAAVRAAYASRARALVDALAGCVDTQTPRGGMFVWGTADVDTRDAFPRAIAAGVAYVPGDACCVARDGGQALRLSFATLAEPDLVTAVGRLRIGLASL